jgi:hypothetical protein
MRPPSTTEFRRLFARVYFNQIRTRFDPGLARPDYTDPGTIATIVDELGTLIRKAQGEAPIPRRIFMLWQQGWDAAPPIVRASADSWRDLNPGWELVLLDEKRLPDWAPGYAGMSETIKARTSRSNIARLNLLLARGGVWADATLFCSRPLDDWLGSVAGQGLFMFSGPRPYRSCEIWFMAAAAENPVLAAWRDTVAAYWQAFSRPHHYYWMEFLLDLALARDPAAREVWDSVPVVPPHGPEIVAANRFDTGAPKAVFDLIEQRRVPVHKLSHKWVYDGRPLAGTPAGLLTGLSRL